MRRLILFALAVISTAPLFAAAPNAITARPTRVTAPSVRLKLEDGDRVAFLGDTFMEREQLESYLETALTSSFPTNTFIFRNIGWSADTPLGESRAAFDPVEKGFDRLKEHLAAVKPTVVFLSHGMASSFNGAEGLPKFEADMRKLYAAIEEVAGPKVRVVILGPIPHEKLPAPLPDPAAHNEKLKLYSEALRTLAQEKQAGFVDLFRRVNEIKAGTPGMILTDNGIHLTPLGYWRVSSLVAAAIEGQRIWRVAVGVDGSVRPGSYGMEVKDVQYKDGKLTWDGTVMMHPLATAPENFKEYRRNGVRLGINGLPEGDFALRINGWPILVTNTVGWAGGPYFNTGPMFDQVEEARELIKKKNELYFHRWRPENETYLFGFRKHEQGQNGKEIPMFDPLIAELEAQVREKLKFKAFQFEIAPATEDDRQRSFKPTRIVAAKAAEKPMPPRKQELPNFQMDEGLEVNLFAENPDLAKPIHMNFDAQGRLWIASSSVYPQIQPGQAANDKIMVMEDTDGDGKADKSTVFADGLLIPTGVAPGDGGVYVANSTELVFFKDTDGDGKADSRRVVFSGFGTEDTHHILHTLRWGFDGQLYMNQSIYIHSHIETPHGVRRLNSGGIWNFRPETMELGIHMKGLVNSWGHHFDKFGQSFATDGASGGDGINWVIPQGMYFTYAGARRIVPPVSPGSYPKFASLEMVESQHFPTNWMGSLVTCDFRAHRVVRFGINDLDTAYVTKEMPDVMRTTNVTFRPIDVKVGPDGALYIADWSNPIIQHGEVDFRDPRRDHEHGRIWRVTAKGRPLLARPDLKKQTGAEMFDDLLSPNNYVRERARRIITERRKAALAELTHWTAAQTGEQALLEALWMHQAIDVANEALLEKILAAKDGRIRAAGVRVLSFWRDRVAKRDEWLAQLAQDEHPRVRMEAMRVLAKIPTAKSAELVLAATEKPMDKYLEYAAWLSINDLANPWIDAVKSGAWKAEGKEKQLAYGLGALTPDLAASVLPVVLPAGDLPRNGGAWIELVGKTGTAKELGRLFNQALSDGFEVEATRRVYALLIEAARQRNARPEGDLARIEKALAASDERVRTEAIRLAGAWKLAALSPKLLETTRAKETPGGVRQAAIQSLRDLGGTQAVKGLTELASAQSELAVRQPAVVTLAALDLKQAAPLAIEVLSATTNENEALTLWRQLLGIKGAAPVFAQALPKMGLPPVMAKTGLRVAREGGRNEPNLVLALARSLEGEEDAKNLTPEELQQLITNVSKNGDPARGERIYRRQELACVSCHAIGGVGGKVGPDMTSIGASAQIDYLVESIQFPNRKIKEGYHGVLLETKDGEELSGVLVRETTEQIVVRDVSNKEVTVAKSSVAKRAASTGSLMPGGLVDGLSAAEQADLYRFLSELGKPGPYDASKGNVARFYKVLSATIDLAQFGDDRIVKRDLNDGAWGAAFAFVDGSLQKSELQRQINRTGNRAVPAVYLAAQFSAPKDGAVNFKLENATPLSVYIDGQPVKDSTAPSADLKAGPHTVIIKLDATKLPESLRLQSPEVTFATQ